MTRQYTEGLLMERYFSKKVRVCLDETAKLVAFVSQLHWPSCVYNKYTIKEPSSCKGTRRENQIVLRFL